MEKILPGLEWYITGSWRPLHMSRVLDRQLAHEIDQGDAAHDLQPLIAVRGKQHIARPQRHALRDRHGFLTQGTDVERNLAGPLIALHSIVEQAGQQHVAQADLQFRRIEMRMPRAHRVAVIVEHAHQIERQRAYVPRARIDVGPRHGAGGRELHVAEIRGFAGPGRRTRQMQARVLVHCRNLRPPAPKCCIHSGWHRIIRYIHSENHPIMENTISTRHRPPGSTSARHSTAPRRAVGGRGGGADAALHHHLLAPHSSSWSRTA